VTRAARIGVAKPQRSELGRGELATRDMALRIAALRADGTDIIEALWQRFVLAEAEGYSYEYAEAAIRRPVANHRRVGSPRRLVHRVARECLDLGA
jgi:hypothetical protein